MSIVRLWMFMLRLYRFWEQVEEFAIWYFSQSGGREVEK